MIFPHYKQLDVMDCGPTCLRMIAKFYKKNLSLIQLRKLSEYNLDGVSMLGISNAAEVLGFKTLGVQTSLDELLKSAPLPAILHWSQNHFVVLPPQKFNGKTITIADPGDSIIEMPIEVFYKQWHQGRENGEDFGIALILEPTTDFYDLEEEKSDRSSLKILKHYTWKYRKYFFQIILSLVLVTIFQLILPFLAQNIVDIGINTRDLNFIYLVLAGQFVIFAAKMITEFIRGWLLIFISTRINLSLLSDFWIKLMRLPLHYFDTKKYGDIMQRVEDHHRIEQFLTGSTISTLFSIFNLVTYSIVMLFYNKIAYSIFFVGSVLYIGWILLFLKVRKKLDYKKFALSSDENSITMHLVQGIHEIKLNNAEHFKRWEWENIQTKLFKLGFEGLTINQMQQSGAFFINESKNILITFIVAKSVLDGELSLGVMMAIQYIIGQLNSPIEQMVGFIQQGQDSKISLERLNEIHKEEDEEPRDKEFIMSFPENRTIEFQNISFKYPGAGNENVLKNLSVSIEQNKVTAIVGMSGSGKTTMLKLLLKYYEEYNGTISIGESNLKNMSPSFWRKNCGIVMQEGYIFSDTIANNIAVGESLPNMKKLVHACKTANLMQFVESLPLGFNTKIGQEHAGVSQGQKQRILIARAVYKDPSFLFLDEATNSLDANNEKEVLDNLNLFFENKTVIIVAHRLSTVKNADKIIVLKDGEIAEEGTHKGLSAKKGLYYELVKNQLELGN
jgi:ATP-binding cassette subfamily B protein